MNASDDLKPSSPSRNIWMTFGNNVGDVTQTGFFIFHWMTSFPHRTRRSCWRPLRRVRTSCWSWRTSCCLRRTRWLLPKLSWTRTPTGSWTWTGRIRTKQTMLMWCNVLHVYRNKSACCDRMIPQLCLDQPWLSHETCRKLQWVFLLFTIRLFCFHY